jgi:hypothetical protein
MEDHFVGHIFGDSDEIDRIRALEHCSNINILPEKFIPSVTPTKPNQEENEEINTGDSRASKLDSDVPPELENAVDKICLALIHGGRDERVDAFIPVMQDWLKLQRRLPIHRYSTIGGAEGMRITRAAFAVMVKMSGQVSRFVDLLDDFEVAMDEPDCP